jgi:hypothetical protein
MATSTAAALIDSLKRGAPAASPPVKPRKRARKERMETARMRVQYACKRAADATWQVHERPCELRMELSRDFRLVLCVAEEEGEGSDSRLLERVVVPGETSVRCRVEFPRLVITRRISAVPAAGGDDDTHRFSLVCSETPEIAAQFESLVMLLAPFVRLESQVEAAAVVEAAALAERNARAVAALEDPNLRENAGKWAHNDVQAVRELLHQLESDQSFQRYCAAVEEVVETLSHKVVF